MTRLARHRDDETAGLHRLVDPAAVRKNVAVDGAASFLDDVAVGIVDARERIASSDELAATKDNTGNRKQRVPLADVGIS